MSSRFFSILSKCALLLVLLCVILVINLLRHASQQIHPAPLSAEKLDANLLATHLAQAIRFRTISSRDNENENAEQFQQMQAYLAQTYPRLHSRLKLEKVGQHSLLYTWQGSDPTLKPMALMAHQDVVPLAAGSERDWQVEPFAGVIKDGFVWGRGAWDNKGNLLAQMEAIELLLSKGFQPYQTLYLIAGADEEVGGLRGAKAIATLLKSRGVQLEFVLDEGLLITDGIISSVAQPVALIGIAEKGYASYRLSVKGVPGHSSMPPRASNIGQMSAALAKLETQPMPAEIQGVAQSMFETLAPEMGFTSRMLMSNLWLFKPLVKAQLEKSPGTNAMLRSTAALTVFHAGERDNILPGQAEAIVNYRLLPGNSNANVMQHIRQTIDNDAIGVTPLAGLHEASPISPQNNAGYRAINRSLRELFPQVVVAPGLMIAGTDAQHFASVSDAVYRFSPIFAKNEDLTRFHGNNERLSLQNLTQAVLFYQQLIRNTNSRELPVNLPSLP